MKYILIFITLFIYLFYSESSISNPFKLGDSWSREVVTRQFFIDNKKFRPILKRIINFSGATGLYLGRKNSNHYLLVSYHICHNYHFCKNKKGTFFAFNYEFSVDQVEALWPKLDMALLSFKINQKDDLRFNSNILDISKVSFREKLYKGQKLIVFGHGGFENNEKHLTYNMDNDCRSFIRHEKIKMIFSPNDLDQKFHKVWAYPVACDLSSGDSGGSVLDMKSGKLVGIVWTGKLPKNDFYQNSENLFKLFYNESDDLWNQLNYVVPFSKIIEKLKKSYIQ